MISQLGTFDVENYGDLLYPLVFRHLLQRVHAGLEVRQYSPLPAEATQTTGFESHPARSLFAVGQAAPCRLIVGGGDILRTDWQFVASHYSTTSHVSYAWIRHSIGTLGIVDHFLRKNVPRLESSAFYKKRFSGRWMNYPSTGPFLINPEDLPAGSAVSYISCGVPHDFEPSECDKVKRTFERARFIYLRDEQSAERLRRAGVCHKLLVAPDLIVTLSDQFNRADEARKGREILSLLGVPADRPVLCFQSKPYPGFCKEEIVRQLLRYQTRAGADVVLLPIGYCHGDNEFLLSLSRQSGGALKYAGKSLGKSDGVHYIRDMLAIIAASDVFVGTSLHGNITAFSFGIPHLFGPLPVAKSDGFLSVVNLPPELKMHSWAEMNDKLDFIKARGLDSLAESARRAKARVYEVFDELIEGLLA
jgi:hypothetical protein